MKIEHSNDIYSITNFKRFCRIKKKQTNLILTFPEIYLKKSIKRVISIQKEIINLKLNVPLCVVVRAID